MFSNMSVNSANVVSNCAACVESLFKSYLEDYAEFELTSLNQLHKAKVQTLLLSWKLKYQKVNFDRTLGRMSQKLIF